MRIIKKWHQIQKNCIRTYIASSFRFEILLLHKTKYVMLINTDKRILKNPTPAHNSCHIIVIYSYTQSVDLTCSAIMF